MEIIAIIPARGGSKSIPRKNLARIGGYPLIAHSIIEAKKSKYITRVIVSTDDVEISNVSKDFGAEVIERPLEISDDRATSESALIHVLETLEMQEEYSPFLTVFLQCTSPLTIVDDIDGTIEKLLNEEADSAFTATDFHYFIWENDEFGNAVGINHDKRYRPRRQDRLPQYVETGAVYVMKTKMFLKYKHRFFGRTLMHFCPLERQFEIDELVDLDIAEKLISHRQNKNKAFLLPEKIEAIFFDFDGVITNNKVYLNEDGIESVQCDRSDGMGFNLIKKLGIKLFILSTEKNNVVQRRADKLKIPALNGLDKKVDELKKVIKEESFDPKNCIFVGNDINDIDCMEAVGCPIAVKDAYEEVKKYARINLDSNGGNGVIRELYELIKFNYNN